MNTKEMNAARADRKGRRAKRASAMIGAEKTRKETENDGGKSTAPYSLMAERMRRLARETSSATDAGKDNLNSARSRAGDDV